MDKLAYHFNKKKIPAKTAGKYKYYYPCLLKDVADEQYGSNYYIVTEVSESEWEALLENLVVNTLIKQITTEKNLKLLTERILTKLQQESTEAANLKMLEKALIRTNKSLSNLLKAIENGIFGDTTKERLAELEAQKKDLTEKILIEKNKERVVPTADEIRNYLKYAAQQTPRNLVDLLANKIIVYTDKIELYLKYTDDTPPTPPYNGDNPDGTNNSDRGFLLTEFTTICEMYTSGGKSRKFDDKAILMRLLL